MKRTHSSTIARKAKHRILKNTAKLLTQKGYSGTSLEEISSKSKLTKGGFYYYFSSKDEVILEALDFFWSEALSELMQFPGSASEDPFERLTSSIKFFEDWISRPGHNNSCLIAGIAQEVGSTNKVIGISCRLKFKEWIDFTANLVSECKKKYPRAQSVQETDLAEFIVASIEGAITLSKCTNDKASYKRAVDQLLDYLNLIFKS